MPNCGSPLGFNHPTNKIRKKILASSEDGKICLFLSQLDSCIYAFSSVVFEKFGRVRGSIPAVSKPDLGTQGSEETQATKHVVWLLGWPARNSSNFYNQLLGTSRI